MCKAALLFPPDYETQNIKVSSTGKSGLMISIVHRYILTGKIKLVSGGSSSVKVSIQVSKSAIGWGVNFVLSCKNRTRKNREYFSTQWKIAQCYCIKLPSMCVLMWLSLADDWGVAILEPTSCKMHCICNEKNKLQPEMLSQANVKLSALREVKYNITIKPCPADMWMRGLCQGKTL